MRCAIRPCNLIFQIANRILIAPRGLARSYLKPRRAREHRGEVPQRPATAKKTMGKKSRRQREAGGAAAGSLRPEKRFEPEKWRHEDGSSITKYEFFQLSVALRKPAMAKSLYTPQGAMHPEAREYISLVIHRKVVTKGVDNAFEAVERWPELRPHWRRIRRRICEQCGRRVALSEPRFMVCGGCGVARYCSEACQITNWGHHQTVCAPLGRQAARERKARAAAKAFAESVDWRARAPLRGVTNGRFVHVDDF